MKPIPVICHGAKEKYDGKLSILRVEMRGRLVTIQGVFRVLPLLGEGEVSLYIDDLRSADPSIAASIEDYRIHMSQGHADSIVPEDDPLGLVAWMVELPFEARTHLSNDAT